MGSVNHGAPDTGAPLKFGGKANSCAPLDVEDGDRTNAWFDLNGRLMIGLYSPGNPYITEQNCTLANANYDLDINASLSRNGHFGFVKSKSTNSGIIQISISYDGTTFTPFMTELLPGESMNLNGMDIDTIRVKSSVPGDDVIAEVH
jgi:hypothetical protein